MIQALNMIGLGASAWLPSNDGRGTIPIRLHMGGTGLVRIEGRNSDAEAGRPLGFLYAAGTLIVPCFKFYRVAAVNLDNGAIVRGVEIGPSVSADDYAVRSSPLLTYTSRRTAKGLRRGNFRTAHVCPFDLKASGTTRAADGATLVTGTAEKDYTNCRSGEVQGGESLPYSIKVSATSGVTSELAYDYRVASGGDGPVDLSGGTNQSPFILMRVYVDPSVQGDLAGNVGTISIGFTDTLGNTGTVVVADFQQFQSSALCGPGWNTFVVHPTTVGSVDFADVHLVRILLTSKTGTSCAVTFDTLQFIRPNVATKLVSFRDDGGRADCWKTALSLDRYGIRGTFYIHPRQVGTSGFASKAELLAMQRAGHAICNGGWSMFPGDELSGPSYEPREVSAESFLIDHVRPAVQWMRDQGFEQGVRIFASPQGNMLPAQADLLLQTDVDMICHRATAGGDATTTNHPNFFEVLHATGYSTTPAAGLLAALDAHGGLGVFRGEGDNPTDNAVMRTVIDAVSPKVRDGTYKAVTPAQLVDGTY